MNKVKQDLEEMKIKNQINTGFLKKFTNLRDSEER